MPPASALKLTELETWSQATATSAIELASAIGLASFKPLQQPSLGTNAPSGAYLPLVGPKVAVQVGFQTTAQGCRELAKALLGMSEEDLAPDIVKDSICEIANMLAGLVKRRMVHLDSGIRLGLPIFVEGRIHPGPGTNASHSYFEAPGIPLAVVVFQPRE